VRTTWAILFLAALAGLTTGCGRRAPTTSGSAGQAATPRGWVAVDYGVAQMSVPADWVRGACPSSAKGTVILGTVAVHCPAYGSDWPALRISPFAGPVTAHEPVRVNGIDTYPVPYRGPGHDIAIVQVPSLGVDVETNGPLFAKILATLTRSPR